MFTFKPWKAKLVVVLSILLGIWGSVTLYSHFHTQRTVKPLGGTYQTPDVAALFETSLTSSITSSATSFILNLGTYNSGATTLASSTYGMIIDDGTASEEIVLADCTATICTNATRGIDRSTGTTTIASLQFSHRRGASVKITDAPSLLFAINVFKGRQYIENILTYNSALSFSTSSNQIPSTLWVSYVANTASTSAKMYADSSFLNLTTNSQTISGNNTYGGVLTFSAKPIFSAGAAFNSILPQSSVAPSTGNDLVNKTYADNLAIAGAPNASLIQKGIVQIASVQQAGSTTAAGSTGALLALPASMSTTTSIVATSSIVMTLSDGKIDQSFLNGTSENYTFNGSTTFATSSVNVGSYPLYGRIGDGSDGAVNLDGSNTFSFLSKSSSTYTMTRDIYVTDLIIQSGSTLVTDGYIIYVSGTISGSGTLDYGTPAAAGNGSTSTGGTAGAAAGSGRLKEVAGSAGANGPNSNVTGNSPSTASSGQLGVAGALGGAGAQSSTAQAGGNGGSSAALSTVFTKLGATAFSTLSGLDINLSGVFAYYKGSSGGNGGGSGGGAASGAPGGGGGGGGSSGGVILLIANHWSGTFTIKALGGAGGVGGNGTAGSGTGGGGGGGAGGGGGVPIVVYATKTWAGSYTLTGGAGGAGGTGNATGSTGVSGTTGVSYEFPINTLMR